MARPPVRVALVESAVLGLSCVLAFWLASEAFTRVYIDSRDSDLLGGMWAALSTIFVNRATFQESLAAGVSRMSATLVSFVICLVYLVFLPFHLWAFGLLIGVSSLVGLLTGRRGDATTAAITTAVVLVVAAISPVDPWQQPILRLVDTVIGVIIGVATAWLSLKLVHPHLRRDTT
ncbi:Fusaric acid resistance protein-like [Asanoa hainanensis]|uniref:Fusaric acid resistance protein-like n=1 Tax=Asanoa hainanensis TaxID=560556 RepID=A0A239NZB8_9ACTN|nr:FUSC family protein [Asanoa hainanensis]SNT60176.1 Fusaric acid resistance protein-like [Asanoa hainanensis]